jgi:site-specific DNA-methyltransferase (adenine-specific)
MRGYTDQGGASRYFSQFHPLDGLDVPFHYFAKASRAERNKGLAVRVNQALVPDFEEGLSEREMVDWPQSLDGNDKRRATPSANNHPTVKSTALMSWLCRLICPPNGIILDPFCGSGSTLVAAIHEGFRCIGIDMEEEYVQIARARVAYAESECV